MFLFNCDHGRDRDAGYDRDHDAGYDRDRDAGYGSVVLGVHFLFLVRIV
jgi:hypothetical protein